MASSAAIALKEPLQKNGAKVSESITKTFNRLKPDKSDDNDDQSGPPPAVEASVNMVPMNTQSADPAPEPPAEVAADPGGDPPIGTKNSCADGQFAMVSPEGKTMFCIPVTGGG